MNMTPSEYYFSEYAKKWGRGYNETSWPPSSYFYEYPNTALIYSFIFHISS